MTGCLRWALCAALLAACGEAATGGGPTGTSDAGVDSSTSPDATKGHDAGGDVGDVGPAASDAGDSACTLGGDPFSTAALQSDVTFLSSDALQGRAPGTPGDQVARAFIEERFRCLGLTPGEAGGSYQQTFTTSAGQSTANVVAYLPGSDEVRSKDIIVVGAHHDHLGVIGGEVYNGANDNASGVAGVLAVAQALRQRATALHRTIAFVTFGYEEHDGECEGSAYFVAHSPAALPIDQVVYMIDLDMIGTYSVAGSLTAYGTATGTSGRAAVDARRSQFPTLQFDLGSNADQDDSDFQAFCNQGVPYVYFETWDEPCCHKPCDDAGRIDYAGMSLVVQLAADITGDLGDSVTDLAAERASKGCSGP